MGGICGLACTSRSLGFFRPNTPDRAITHGPQLFCIGQTKGPLMDPFRNLQINLLARGGWAALAIIAICVTILGLFGAGELAGRAMTALLAAGLLSLGAIAAWSRR